ncbi:MAG: hypothetical protein HY457_00320 [Parcubacteria group bacterium]|nr:hypothetical protein [Parcubacteria group bacterium]
MTILASVLFFPWWVGVALGVLATAYFQKFYEVAALAFLFDVLYGAKVELLYGFQFVFAAGAIALLIVSEWVKGYLRWY